MKKRIICSLFLLIILLLSLISERKNNSFFSFTRIKENVLVEGNFFSWTNLYYGVFSPYYKDNLTKASLDVSSYDYEIYENGAFFYTDSEVVTSLTDGVVINVSGKDNKKVIIQAPDGKNYEYGNLLTTEVFLYSYIRKDTIIGSLNKRNSEYAFYLAIRDYKYIPIIEVINN